MACKIISIVSSSVPFLIAFFLVSATSIITVSSNLISPQIAMAQKEKLIPLQQKQLANLTSVQQQQIMKRLSFEMGNVTFRHQLASVNGIAMHYVIGGQGDPVVLLHGFPETWYAWHEVMPILAKNHTVVAVDMRGMGDSSKPETGYDSKNTAEDIYQLISQLGFRKIFLVGHDIGTQTAYAFSAIHPNSVSKLVELDGGAAGFISGPAAAVSEPFHYSFQREPLADLLTTGKEREYISYTYRAYAYNPAAVSQETIDKYVTAYSAPGAMHAAFGYYKALPTTIEIHKELAKTKLPMPVLALGGGVWGGTAPLDSMKLVATNVRGGTIPFSGHWIPEEQPEFLASELEKFFSGK